MPSLAARPSMLMGAAAAGVLLAAAPASAAVYCVPTTAVAGDCTAASATLQAALDSARTTTAGVADTIRLGAGTFAGGTTTFSPDGAPTTIVGAGRDATFIEGAGSGNVLEVHGSAVTLRDLEVRLTSGDGTALRSQNSIIEGVDVSRPSDGVGDVFTYSGPTTGDPQVTNVRIRRPGTGGRALYFAGVADQIEITGGDGGDEVYLTGGSLTRAKIVSGVGLNGIYVTGSGFIGSSSVTVTQLGADGILVGTSGSSGSLTVRDVTVTSTAAATPGVALSAGTFQPFTASLVATGIASRGFAGLGCAGTNDAGGTASVQVGYAVAPAPTFIACAASHGYSNAGTETTSSLGHLTTAVPGFTDFAAGDLVPLAGGNLIDAGDPASLSLAERPTDVAGTPRVIDGDGNGSAVRDIGGYEFTPPTPTPTPGVATPTPTPGAATPTPSPTPKPSTKIESIKFSGKLKAPAAAKTTALTTLKKAPKSGTPLFTVKLSAPVKLTATLARRNAKKQYKTVKGSASIAAAGTTLLLKPTGSWNKKRLTKGTYKLTLKGTGMPAKSVTFKVR